MYFYYARYKPMNMALTFWTFLEVLLSLFVCIPTILVAFLRFRVLEKERHMTAIICEIKSWRHLMLRVSIIPTLIVHPLSQNLREKITSERIENDAVRLTINKNRVRVSTVLEYIILAIFVVAIVTFELLYGLLMVFIQLSAQVEASIIQVSTNDTEGCDAYCQAQNEKQNNAVNYLSENGIYDAFKPRQHCIQTIMTEVDGEYEVLKYTQY